MYNRLRKRERDNKWQLANHSWNTDWTGDWTHNIWWLATLSILSATHQIGQSMILLIKKGCTTGVLAWVRFGQSWNSFPLAIFSQIKVKLCTTNVIISSNVILRPVRFEKPSVKKAVFNINVYAVFDSHSRSYDGLVHPTGKKWVFLSNFWGYIQSTFYIPKITPLNF